MGRYLAAGIMTRFDVRKKKGWFSDKKFNLEKEIDNVLKDINNIIDSSMYDLVEKKENRYDFALKPELFNKNIHELIREIKPLTNPNLTWISDIIKELEENGKTIYDKEFIEKYPIQVNISKNGEYSIEINNEVIEEDYPFYPMYCLINDKDLFNNVEIHIAIILLWIDYSKYDSEDETEMLRIINNMKAKYYSSPLSKSLIYYIIG